MKNGVVTTVSDLAIKHQHILKGRNEHAWQEELKIERLQIKALLAQPM